VHGTGAFTHVHDVDAALGAYLQYQLKRRHRHHFISQS
jgi:hypothetical protein